MSSGQDPNSYIGIGVGVDTLPKGVFAGETSVYSGAANLRQQAPAIPSASGLANVVVVNDLSHFPPPVAGVIELVPSPGAEIVYELGALDVNIGALRFTITNGEVVIRGAHRTASRITSTLGAGVLFTSVDAAFFQEFLAVDCPGMNVFNFTNPSGGFNSLVNQNLIIIDCASIGTVAGTFVTSLRTLTVAATSVGGLLWVGAANGQINMSNCLALGWTGTLLDLGTAVFGIIDIDSNNRFISPAGTTILSGLPDSGNLTPVTGRGFVNGSLFNGVGTPLVGVNHADIQWIFANNGGVQNSRIIGAACWDGNAVSTSVTNGAYGPLALSGVSAGTNIERWELSDAATAELTYIGLTNFEGTLIASLHTELGNITEANYRFAISKNGATPVYATAAYMPLSLKDVGDSITLVFSISVVTGDRIKIDLAGDGSGADLVMGFGQISIR